MSSPAALTKPSIRHLFATPLITCELPPDIAAQINPRLKDSLLKKEQEMPSRSASNTGGWQSDDKILVWGGDDVQTLVASITTLVNEVTARFDNEGAHHGDIKWKVNGWANINRKGNANVAHIHPGAFWSAVYYVSVDESDDENNGGNLRLFDPRGGLSLMYCPVLRISLEGYLSAGNSELHRPRSGQCVLFPSWLSHAVTPYIGEGTRISLAFNFSV